MLNLDVIHILQSARISNVLVPAVAEALTADRSCDVDSVKEAPNDDISEFHAELRARQAVDLMEQFRSLAKLPIGWNRHDLNDFTAQDWLFKIVGIFITVFFSALGSAFWLRLLNKGQDIHSIFK